MAQHVKVLGVLHLVFGGLGILGGLMVLLVFGGLAGIAQLADRDPNVILAIPILGGIGGVIFLLALAFSLPSLIAGWGLLQFRPWARILGIVMSGLNLLNVPFGTALGAYGLWVLLSTGTEVLFGDAPRRPFNV